MTLPHPIQPQHLLDLADELARGSGAAGRPRPIWLRRSTSTAYYAVFHELSFRAVSELLASDTWGETEASVARWIAHTDLADLAKAATGSGVAALRQALGVLDERVVRISADFLALQDARHSADYDDTFAVSRTDALSWAQTARVVVERSRELVREGEPTYRRFLRLAVGSVKVAKRR